jgi:adenylate kinase
VNELNLIFLGPPGAGKGTQAERLIDQFDLPYYATGDILRAAVKENSELGQEAKQYMDRGDLVPDALITEVIMERVDSEEAEDGFLLDGFPRTVGQAETLDSRLDELGRQLTAVLVLEVSDEEVLRRLSGRRICEENGHLFHVEFDPPEQEGVCDLDGSSLVQRDDDKPDKVKHRLEQYHEKTEPLVEHYEDKGLLHRFDAKRPAGEVGDRISATLRTLRLEAEA